MNGSMKQYTFQQDNSAHKRKRMYLKKIPVHFNVYDAVDIVRKFFFEHYVMLYHSKWHFNVLILLSLSPPIQAHTFIFENTYSAFFFFFISDKHPLPIFIPSRIQINSPLFSRVTFSARGGERIAATSPITSCYASGIWAHRYILIRLKEIFMICPFSCGLISGSRKQMPEEL